MRKGLAVLCALGLACMPLNTARMETVPSYASIVRTGERLECPAARLDELISDELPLLAAQAMRQWFIGEYLTGDDWYDEVWNHTSVILTEPYVIGVAYATQRKDDMTLYGFAVIASYGLYRGKDDQLYLAEVERFDGLFRAYYRRFVDDDWRLQDVHCLLDMDEELYPGAGRGTDGYPGMTDALDALIPSEAWSTAAIAQRYLDLNGLIATIIAP